MFFDGDGFKYGGEFRARAGRADAHLGAFVLTLGQHFDPHAIAQFDFGKISALGVEQIDRRLGAGEQRDDRALALGRFVFNRTQRRKPGRAGRADQASAIAVRAAPRGSFEHPGAEPLAAHFHQSEARDPANLDPRPIILERVLHRLFDLTDVVVVLHVDEVDHHQPGHIAQPQLARNFARRFEVGVERGRLDPVFLGRAARVDIDRDQGLGRVDHDVAARFELHFGIVHRGQLILCAKALEQRDRIGVLFYPLGVAGHQQLHKVARGAVARFALDHDVFDFLVVDVADCPLDQVAVRMDQGRSAGPQRGLADPVPQPGEVIKIALDLGLGAAEPGGADDAAHGARQVHFADDRFEALAISGRIDLAADPAAMAGIGHQHAIAARQAQIGGQRRAFVAAFFLDDLDQQHLAALDHVLNFVAAAQRHPLGTQFVGFLGVAAIATATLAAASAAALVVSA